MEAKSHSSKWWNYSFIQNLSDIRVYSFPVYNTTIELFTVIKFYCK